MKDEVYRFIKKHPLLIVLLVALIFYIIWIWLPLGILHSWNESYYLTRVSHIIEGGSYLDGKFDNPPLFVYILTAFSKIIGVNIFVFRLFIIFCTIVTTFFIYQLGLIFGNKKIAITSSALFAFFPEIVLFSKIIQIEMFVIMLMICSFYFAVIGIKKNKKWFWASGLFLGLIVLTKFPMALVIIPIFYYMFYSKVEIKYYLFIIIETILVPLPWVVYVFMTNPYFFASGGGSSQNFFGLGLMHTEAPTYQLAMVVLAFFVFIFLIMLYQRKKPFSLEEKTLFLFALIFSGFFLLLPNHEYYLLPFFVPFFLFISLIYLKEKKWEKLKKIIGIFSVISLVFLIARPVYEVNWEEACNYVKDNFSKNITVYSTSPRVVDYYLSNKVIWLHPNNIENLTNNRSIIMFTRYDTINLRSTNIPKLIEEDFILLKNFEDKIFIYGSKNNTGEIIR